MLASGQEGKSSRRGPWSAVPSTPDIQQIGCQQPKSVVATALPLFSALGFFWLVVGVQGDGECRNQMRKAQVGN